MVGLAVPSGAYQRPGRTARVSIASDGSEARRAGDDLGLERADSSEPSLSADGRFIAFTSSADNLVPGDTNLVRDVFVHDRVTGKTELVSATSSGIPATGTPPGSVHPQISANGRHVAFVSYATDLVPGDSNLAADVFVRDLVAGTIERVSVASGSDAQANADSDSPSISRDGRVIAFRSEATNLTSSGTSGVFLHEAATRETVQIAAGAAMPSISGNARYVAFMSPAAEPGDGDVNAVNDVFAYDRQEDSVERISVSSDGSVGNRFSSLGSTRSISDDGRYVLFESPASNLVPNDTNTTVIGVDGHDVFVRDRKTQRTERISTGAAGEEIIPMDSVDHESEIDPSGRFVAYSTYAAIVDEDEAGLYPNPDLSLWDAYVFDRATGYPEILSVGTSGRQGSRCDPDSHRAVSPTLSMGGRYGAFSSCSGDLVARDTNGAYDIFLRDRGRFLGTGLETPSSRGPEPGDEAICLVAGLCIPPGAAISASDHRDDVGHVLEVEGSDLIGASLAHRPRSEDLLVAIELDYMAPVEVAAPELLYGLRFEAGDRRYEVRATSAARGTFGLFDCSGPYLCNYVGELRGGFGTTGMRVVFSLPLGSIGLLQGGALRDVEAFSALGTWTAGAMKVIDRVGLD